MRTGSPGEWKVREKRREVSKGSCPANISAASNFRPENFFAAYERLEWVPWDLVRGDYLASLIVSLGSLAGRPMLQGGWRV
jgi:hypothetical protein